MQEFILFLMTFLLVLMIYELFIVKRAKPRKEKKGKKEKKIKEPMEVTYLVHKYHLDLEKVNYNRLLQVVAFTSSFDIALVVSLILFVKVFILEIIVGFFCTLILIYISYHIVYLIYKKKGMIKNES